MITPDASQDAFWVRGGRTRENSGELRPSLHVQHLRGSPGSADTVYEYATSGLAVYLDGGRTVVRYPGPSDQTLVLVDVPRSRLVRIDRPVDPDVPFSSVHFTEIDASGNAVRSEEIRFAPVDMSSSQRDSIGAILLQRASWGGGRSISDDLRADLEELVAEIPTRLPAFREAALSEDGSIWLSLSGTSEADGRWIVVDRWFRPIATLRLSPNLIDIGAAQKDGWLSVGTTDLDVRYIARVVVDREPSAPDLPRAH